MNVNLDNIFEKFITDLLETGLYQSRAKSVIPLLAHRSS
jgi:Arc/MetJ-type ribon-helix-helix transcriptional regulator